MYDWLTEKEYTEYLLGNEDDEYGGNDTQAKFSKQNRQAV